MRARWLRGRRWYREELRFLGELIDGHLLVSSAVSDAGRLQQVRTEIADALGEPAMTFDSARAVRPPEEL